MMSTLQLDEHLSLDRCPHCNVAKPLLQKLRTPGADNHWLDCLVGSAVAGSMQGAILFGTDVKRPPRMRVSFAEMQREARARARAKIHLRSHSWHTP